MLWHLDKNNFKLLLACRLSEENGTIETIMRRAFFDYQWIMALFAHKKIFLLFTSLILAGLLLLQIGCGKHESPVAKANREKVLLVGNAGEPPSLDPHFATTIPEFKILMALFEGLVIYHPETLEPQPGVAESWDISEDRKVYTFHLRKEARWSHGQPVLAQDFAFAFERILNPALGCPYATQFFVLKNAQAFHSKEATDFAEVGIKVLDEHTLELTLEQPIPHFLSLLCTAAWYPVHSGTLIKHHAQEHRHTAWTRPGNLVSNGPFMLLANPSQGVAEVTQNPNYWNKDIVQIRKIRFMPFQDASAEERAFRNSQLHVTDGVPLHLLNNYIAEQSPYLHMSPYLGLDFYVFNTQRKPFDDIRVRKAFNMAISREHITRNILHGTKIPAYSFTPPNIAGYTSRAQVVENIAEAKKLLAQAGYPGGKGFPEVELLFNSSEGNALIAEAVQGMLKANLGVTVKLNNQEYKSYLANRSQRNYDFARSSWVGDYVDPSTFLYVYTGYSGNNYSGWLDEAYDKHMEGSCKMTDPKARYECMQAAETILLEQLPIMPLFYYIKATLLQSNVEGWSPNLLDVHPYQYVQLKGN